MNAWQQAMMPALLASLSSTRWARSARMNAQEATMTMRQEPAKSVPTDVQTALLWSRWSGAIHASTTTNTI